jgi:hypothetical protein
MPKREPATLIFKVYGNAARRHRLKRPAPDSYATAGVPIIVALTGMRCAHHSFGVAPLSGA